MSYSVLGTPLFKAAMQNYICYNRLANSCSQIVVAYKSPSIDLQWINVLKLSPNSSCWLWF